jgi:hypothetical protein
MLVLALSSTASAHELTPTYPKLRSSYVDGVSVTSMLLFNRREDIRYYEIEVFNKEWERIAFATSSRILTVNYLERKSFEVYIRDKDKKYATYICTRSKLIKNDKQVETSVIASRICSKLNK